VGATRAPRGQTLVLRHRFSRKRLSMSGSLAHKPGRSATELMFQVKPGSCNIKSLVVSLQDLDGHFGGAKVTLIWNNLPSHKSRAMRRASSPSSSRLTFSSSARSAR
jgi:hypothetical protein